ncbi:MerR family transcriptional regulator [Acidimicrobiaceae bacterium]|nr:MerR family transcriptional regulator [Acidimicrobiaceae bacterium]
MNIGDASKLIKKDFPSISISRIRFLEKEGLIKPRRSKGGTRSFTEKDIIKIKKILDLQENQYYTLKAIKNTPNMMH